MAKILGIGNTVLDIVSIVESLPNEDQEIRALDRYNQLGGNVHNTLYVLHQLGHETAICSSVAIDTNGKKILAGLQDHQINSHYIQKFIQGSTPCSHVTINTHNGSRTIVHYRDMPEVQFEHFAKIEIENYDWLHFEGRNLENLKGMLNIAKTFLDKQPISLEVEKDREGIEEILHQANVIIFSHHFAKQKGFNNGHELIENIRSMAPNSHLVCTWGAQGVWYQSPNQPTQHLDAINVHPIIDTLGAGDTFNAGLISALIEKNDLSIACKKANELAAKKIQKKGLDNLLSMDIRNQAIANIRQLSKAKATIVNVNGRPDIVLIMHDKEVKAYENNCPHQNVPLNEAYKIDIDPFEKTMKCSVHDAFFKIENGECIDGPCWGEHLRPVSIKVDENDDVYLA